MLKNVATRLGVLEAARATRTRFSDALLRCQQKLGLAASEHRVAFNGREIGFPIRSAHARDWFIRYQNETQNGWHEPSLTRLFEALLQDKKCLIDVGAHLGYFSLLFAAAAGRTAYSIELNPRTFSVLQKMQRHATGIEGQVIEANLGFSDQKGEVFVRSGHTSPTFSLERAEEGNARRGHAVEVTTLDRFCEETGATPDVIKIDVEGFERQVWQGGQGVISLYRPIIVMELHTPQLEAQGIFPADFIAEIEKAEYAVFSTKDHRTHRAQPFLPLDEIPPAPNFDILCIPKESVSLYDLDYDTDPIRLSRHS